MSSNISENNKRIAKNTLLLYFRMLLIMTTNLYTSRVVLSALGVEDFGIYNVVGGVVTMFTFLNTAMAGATQRFLTFELGRGDKVKLHKVFCISLNIHALISLIIFLLAETVGLWFLNTQMNIPEFRMYAGHWVYQLSVLSTIVLIMSAPYNASIIAHERMSVFAYISLFEVFSKLVVAYAIVSTHFDRLIFYALFIFVTQLLVRLIYGLYCKKHFEECHYKYLNDMAMLKEMSSFAVWSLFGNLAGIAFTQGINILLNLFFGPIVNAARAIAVQVQTAVQGFVTNFQTALNPQITKTYATGELAQMHKLLFASSRYSFYLLFIIALPLIIEVELVLSVWLKVVPEYTAEFVRLILIIMLVDTLANPFITAASATGRIKLYQTVVGGVLLLIVPLSYFALKLGFSPVAVFVVHFVMAILAHVVRLIIIRPMIQLSIRRYISEVILIILRVILASVWLPLIIYILLPKSTLLSFLLVCTLCVCSTLGVVYFLGINQTERIFVCSKITSIVKKFRIR